LAKTGTDPPTRSYKYKVEQTPRGALITVCGDAIDEVVADYARLRVGLETEGFRIALEE
jgi:hypothetical protein